MTALTALVVEDEPLILMNTADELTELGYLVLEAPNAAAAIATMTTHPEVSILFTDIDMPGNMDGLQLAEAVRDGWPPVRIIVTSGHRRVVASDMPADCRFFSKPYQTFEVRAAIQEMMA